MNTLIKNYAKVSGVKLWQVAEALGMQDSNLSKKLRHQLAPAEEQRICDLIDQIAASQEKGKGENENENNG